MIFKIHAAFLAYLYTDTSDYNSSMVPRQISFSLSNGKECFNVPIVDDDVREGTENFMLTFDIPIDQEVDLTPRIFDVEIIDNDEGK